MRLLTVMTLFVGAACSRSKDQIPAVNGPLALDVRFPLSGSPAPAQDSTAIWGTVGTGLASLTVNGARVQVEQNGTFAAFLPLPVGTPTLRFVARRGADSSTSVITLNRASDVSDTTATHDDRVRRWSHWVTMRRLPSDTADSATQWRPIYSRWRPSGEIAVPLPIGMRMLADARTDRSVRLRLAGDARVWIPIEEADTGATPRVEHVAAGSPTITLDSSGIAIRVSLSARLPSTVEIQGDQLYWTIYGVRTGVAPTVNVVNRGAIRTVAVRDTAPERLVIQVGLASMPLGWRMEWRSGALTLRLRNALAPSATLHDLVVAVDAGHPPDGTVGPSRLSEDSVTLAVALATARKLRTLGVTVIMTRRDAAPMSLEARALVAEQSAAHLFISVHLNSPAPGRPPEAVNGTQVFFFNPNGRALAHTLLLDVAAALQQKPLSASRREYAVLRPAWTTAVLVEGAGIVLPEREAFFRTDAGIDAYAQGIVNGIVRWHGETLARQVTATPVVK